MKSLRLSWYRVDFRCIHRAEIIRLHLMFEDSIYLGWKMPHFVWLFLFLEFCKTQLANILDNCATLSELFSDHFRLATCLAPPSLHRAYDCREQSQAEAHPLHHHGLGSRRRRGRWVKESLRSRSQLTLLMELVVFFDPLIGVTFNDAS